MRIKKTLSILFIFLLSACFHGTDVESEIKRIQPDFWLNRAITDYDYWLLWSTDSKPTGGIEIIPECIQQIESNDRFIIATQKPKSAEMDSVGFNYYIIDLTKYRSPNRDTFKKYVFDDKDEFEAKKKELGVAIVFE